VDGDGVAGTCITCGASPVAGTMTVSGDKCILVCNSGFTKRQDGNMETCERE